ncbi:hypothetical protein [Acinetobacter colistiniresistens]|uniref:hypothetical protein n=1 Tax=Acinetobacter colistiniresistens TaxID=280145 RepID=UPI002FE0CEC5
MNTIEEIQQSINLCIAEVKKYKPLTLDEYKPIYNILNRYVKLNSFLIFMIPVSILVTIASIVIWVYFPNINVIILWIVKIALALSFIQFTASIYLDNIIDSKLEKIISANNLNTYWLDLDSFNEISADTYQLISELTEDHSEFKQKVKQVLTYRNGKLLTFDYYNLKTNTLKNLNQELKEMNESKRKRDSILSNLIDEKKGE